MKEILRKETVLRTYNKDGLVGEPDLEGLEVVEEVKQPKKLRDEIKSGKIKVKDNLKFSNRLVRNRKGEEFNQRLEASTTVVKARPNTGGKEYIRLHLEDGTTYKWKGRVGRFDISKVKLNPGEESRWVKE